MKKVLICILFIGSLSNFSYSQTLYSTIKDKLDEAIREDSRTWKVSDYEGSLTLTDAKEVNGIIHCEGTFKYSVLTTGTIHYKAKVKAVLDEIVVQKIWWTQPVTDVTYIIGSD